MFSHPELKRIEARKAELLAESAAHRVALAAAGAELRRSAGWIELGFEFVRRVRRTAGTAADVGVFFQAWRRHGVLAWLPRIATTARLFGRLRAMWKERGRADEEAV